MKSAFIPPLLLSLSCALLSAQSLQVDALRHDFGRIAGTAKVSHAFKLTNTGDKDLVIASIRPSCGCTTTVLGKSTLAPGEGTAIEATFVPGNQGGRTEKTILVSSNDPTNPTTTLTLAAEVLRELYLEPPGATFFELPRKGTRNLTLRVKSDTGPVALDAVEAKDLPYLKVQPRSLGGESFLELRLDAARLPKDQPRGHGSFEIRTSKPAVASLLVPVMWSVARVFEARPERIGLQMEAGQERRIRVRVRRADGKPFRLVGPKETPRVDLRAGILLPENPSGTELELTVLIPRNLPPGPHADTVQVGTDDPEESVLTIPVSVLVSAPPAKPAPEKPQGRP